MNYVDVLHNCGDALIDSSDDRHVFMCALLLAVLDSQSATRKATSIEFGQCKSASLSLL